MPSGRVHFMMSMMMNVPIALWAIQVSETGSPDMTAAIVAGAVAGTFITPDYDLEGSTFTESWLKRIPIVGKQWQIEWYPYALYSDHRGVSHWLVLGTALRALYIIFRIWRWLVFFCGIGVLYFGRFHGLEQTTAYFTWLPTLSFLSMMFLVWTMHDSAHIIADRFEKPRKKRKGIPGEFIPFELDY